jgi:hypothetical protein
MRGQYNGVSTAVIAIVFRKWFNQQYTPGKSAMVKWGTIKKQTIEKTEDLSAEIKTLMNAVILAKYPDLRVTWEM